MTSKQIGEKGMWIKNLVGRRVWVGEFLGKEMIKNKTAVLSPEPEITKEKKSNEK